MIKGFSEGISCFKFVFITTILLEISDIYFYLYYYYFIDIDFFLDAVELLR